MLTGWRLLPALQTLHGAGRVSKARSRPRGEYRVQAIPEILRQVQVHRLLRFPHMGGFSDAREPDPDHIRTQYWAASFGGAHPEMAAVAVPVFAPQQTLIGALSVSGPRYRLEERGAESMVPALLKAARELTQCFGGDATVFDA